MTQVNSTPPAALSSIVTLICNIAQDVSIMVQPGGNITTDILLGSTLLGQVFGNLSNFSQAYADWKALTPAQVDSLVLQLEAGFPSFGNAKVSALIPQIGALLEAAFGVVQAVKAPTAAPSAPTV